MSKKLAALLQKPEHVVAKAIDELEDKAGYPSADVRLLAENHLNLRSKITQLGLDADDTTGQELYQALLARFGRDAERVEAATGTVAPEQKLGKAVELIKHAGLPEVWALKSSTAKKLLKTQPPKKTAKLLGYRSIDSMLKREDPLAVYAVASAVESAVWQKAAAKSIAVLDSTNYETRQVNIIQLGQRYSKLNLKNPIVVNVKLGLVAIADAKKFQTTPVLVTTLQILDNLRAQAIQTQKDISSLHPALGWWAGTKHLMANLDGQPVSLNIHDAANNHAGQTEYGNHTTTKGAESLWQELTSRYQAIAGEFKAPEPVDALAPEYVSVE